MTPIERRILELVAAHTGEPMTATDYARLLWPKGDNRSNRGKVAKLLTALDRRNLIFWEGTCAWIKPAGKAALAQPEPIKPLDPLLFGETQ